MSPGSCAHACGVGRRVALCPVVCGAARCGGVYLYACVCLRWCPGAKPAVSWYDECSESTCGDAPHAVKEHSSLRVIARGAYLGTTHTHAVPRAHRGPKVCVCVCVVVWHRFHVHAPLYHNWTLGATRALHEPRLRVTRDGMHALVRACWCSAGVFPGGGDGGPGCSRGILPERSVVPLGELDAGPGRRGVDKMGAVGVYEA